MIICSIIMGFSHFQNNMFDLHLVQGKCLVINYLVHLLTYSFFSQQFHGYLYILVFSLILEVPKNSQLGWGGKLSRKLFLNQTHLFSIFMLCYFLLSGFSMLVLNFIIINQYVFVRHHSPFNHFCNKSRIPFICLDPCSL